MSALYSSLVRTETRLTFFRSIRGKLILLFLTVAIIPLSLVGGVAISQLNVSKTAADEVGKNYLPDIVNLDNAEIALLRIVEAQRNHIVAPNQTLMGSMEAEIKTQRETLTIALAAFEATLDPGAEAEAFQKFQDALNNFLEVSEQMVSLSRSNQDQEAQALSVGPANNALEKVVALIETMREINVTESEEAVLATDAAIRSGITLTLTIAVVAALAVIVVAFFVANSITNPILTVTEIARKLAVGNVNQTVELQSRDEIGIMADAFSQMITYQQQMARAAGRLAQGDVTVNITPQSDNDVLGNAFSQMITNLRNLISQVADTASTVGAASDQLATAASQAGQASQQVTSTIQQIAQGTTQQTQSVAEATNNTEQTARAAEGIAKGAQEQAQGVQKTSGLVGEMANIVDQVGQVTHSVGEANTKVTQAARHGVSVVGQTSQGMDTIRVRTLAAADKVKEMTTRSKEIGRIVETIDDIADKTDMLALNAAVEAARAGEHGRGFAVVADQVRKLSEDSKGATRDIADLIERVQDTVREAIGAMESTVTEVDNGARLAGDTARSLEEILLAAEGAAALATQIGGAVSQLRQKSEGVVEAIGAVSAIVEENTSVAEEMAAGSQQVLQAMEGVASVAEENSASAEEVSASAEEMSAQVEEVVASAQELSSLAEQLRAAVAQFQVDEAGPTQSERPSPGSALPHVLVGQQRSRSAPVLADHQGNGNTNRA